MSKQPNSNDIVWYRNSDVYNNPEFVDKPGYPTYHAYNRYSRGGINIVDRSGKFTMPIINHVPECLKIPEFKSTDLTYSDCCRLRARELLDHSKNIDKQIVVLYSGGIDSSTIVSSFLDVCDDSSDFERVIIAHTENSIIENPSLYEIIKRKFKRISSGAMGYLFDGRFIIVHGECNDQLFGSQVAVNAERVNGIDFLKSETNRQNLVNFVFQSLQEKKKRRRINYKYFYEDNDERDAFLVVDRVFKPLMDSTDIDLSKLYYLLWYINFAFKWQNVYYRICAIDCYEFGLKNLYTHFSFFNTDNFQLWCLNNLHSLIDLNSTMLTYKQPAKDYIYTITKDEEYRVYKLKKGSLFHVYKGQNVIHKIFADDSRSSEHLTGDIWVNQNSFV